jgi:signal recognition particle receptor subunit beta
MSGLGFAGCVGRPGKKKLNRMIRIKNKNGTRASFLVIDMVKQI